MKRFKGFTDRPLRDVVLNLDELREHAENIAQNHLESGIGKTESLRPGVEENMRCLREAYAEISDYTYKTKDLIPAAEWFLDNYYRLKDLDKDIKKNMPASYERRLFPLERGEYKGFPRILALMTELIEHTDSQLQEKSLKEFINAYQKVIPLSSAEIWAIPIILRVILLENIRWLAAEVIITLREREKAEKFFANLSLGLESSTFPETIEDLTEEGHFSPTFVERLSRRLRELGTEGKFASEWLDKAVLRQNSTVEDLIGLEHQKQAACQVSMGHAITSLQFLNAQEWPIFFEEISCVEQLLKTDPGNIYARMDFDSRDAYRHQIEKLSRKHKIPELLVAQNIIKQAQSRSDPEQPAQAHIGYDLFKRKDSRLSQGLYVGSFFTLWVILVILATYFSAPQSWGGWLAIALLSAIPLSTIAMSGINAAVTRFLPPVFFPKLDFGKGIPEEYRTMIVIPTLLPEPERVKELFRQLEVYYLANQDDGLHFALLGDFTDAESEEAEGDQSVIAEALSQVKSLQEKYGKDKFYFFHRRRQWNDGESTWMGWERKRGKLLEFNRLLLGDQETTYDIQEGDLSLLSRIHYVITLDADTQLPRDGAHKLIGAMAHPLQAPVLSQDGKRVEHGYGIIQPRIGISVLAAEASPFARLFSGSTGIDPYTKAISDVYQDLFGEGIFTGKGIYDVKVFHQLTGSAFPENIVLSHDLLEGLYARTGLASDIELLDGYPGKYFSYISRLHRWVRGDWQLIRWLKSALPWQGKWKIGDNLRRSLESPAQYLLLCLGVAFWPGKSWLWLGLVLFSFLWPVLIGLLPDCWRHSERDKWKCAFNDGLMQSAWQFVMLPYQAWMMVDAIVRSLYRQFISHKNLLEWQTADHVERNLILSQANAYYRMMPGWGSALIVTALLWGMNNKGAWIFSLAALVWLLGPLWAYRASLPVSEQEEALNSEQTGELRLMARRIWGYFEQFVNEDEHFLPPDNVQIDPPNGVAHRTSPTNIGLALLAGVSAWDFGYLTASSVLERTEKTLDTLDELEQWHGHLYNWYDTRSLQPLQPLYVSAVDSGNLVVYLLTLQSGIRDMMSHPRVELKHIQGLQDTYALFARYIDREKAGEENIDRLPENLKQWLSKEELDLIKLAEFLQVTEDHLAEYFHHHPKLHTEGKYWGARLQEMMAALRAETTGLNDQEKLREQEDLAERLQERLQGYIDRTNFTPLYDEQRGLFSIGYRVGEGKLDSSYYDLLASEARQASFIAIAKGELPQSHWFRLGRSLTKVEGTRSLVSWSGTMFEFLMPLLIMRNYPRTLLDETYRSVVEIQRLYGRKLNIPWGISESGFHAFDAQFNYQYKAFGVPGLGLKRGLIQDQVIAPYATFLALMVAPRTAYENLEQMNRFLGRFGLYEAVDYTPERVRNGERYQVVQSFMAHHQGMSLLALTNVLHDNCFQERFHAHATVQGAELLLQERLPGMEKIVPPPSEIPGRKEHYQPVMAEGKSFLSLDTPHTLVPSVHLIGNGKYSVMLTNSGSGYSRFENIAVTRWREDETRDRWGTYFYIQNLNSGDVWSAAYHPCRSKGENYQVTYAPDRVEYCRRDGNLVTRTEVAVSPEDQVEIRRISLTNHSQAVREVEITSYLEVVLCGQNEDLAHPAFAKLFVQTEFTNHALLASRRARQENQPAWHMMHTLASEGEASGAIQYETDRMRFIGRGRDLEHPQALEPNQPLSNTTGEVLDPIMSLRLRVKIRPGQTLRMAFSTGIAESREEAMALAEKYREPSAVQRAFELAWTHSQMELRHLNLSAGEANEALALGSGLVYRHPERGTLEGILRSNRLAQPDLWPHGISGDWPVVLVKVSNSEHLSLVNQLIIMHEYWRRKGLFVDLVILNEDKGGYLQALQDSLQDLVAIAQGRSMGGRPGGIFLLQAIHLKAESINLLHTVARMIFDGREGSWTTQRKKKLKLLKEVAVTPDRENRVKSGPPDEEKGLAARHFSDGEELLFFNGLGGFSSDGKEYVIRLDEGVNTPLPWINVLANPQFGCLVSEAGAGYTWSQNSRENKITPWNNDPVLDSPGEGLYLRDEEGERFWSPLPNPVRDQGRYTIRHGQGYTSFSHVSHELKQETTIFVPKEDRVKIIRLTVSNLGMHRRRLSATYYVEWVLGVARDLTAPYIITEADEEQCALLATNVYQQEFKDRVGILRGYGGQYGGCTGDRRSFIGRNGDLSLPAGMSQPSLSGPTGAGLDPCGALRISFTLDEGEEKTVWFLLGEGESKAEAYQLTEGYGQPRQLETALNEVKEFWNDLLEKVQVETPDASLDLLLNRWLLYQTLVCRIWARSAFYQSGGAYGFRDQLQDAMALITANPGYTREQIVLHAAHQFTEGDVQHWWHKEGNKGIRTKFSDDLLWLPYVTAYYLEWTQDQSILEENVSFIQGAVLGEHEDERYETHQLSEANGSVYEHCIRAIERGIRLGEHGLPLIGTGDWNDGFSRVGRLGKGESVWLGWFLYLILKRFIPICMERNDQEKAERYAKTAEELIESLERYGWDGGWYRRAYFDDGTPMGSANSKECQIDAIAQSWAVLSGAAKESRIKDAMAALENYLWCKDEGMLLLLTPSFDSSCPDPGYIRGYVPGVRENGGQYTHGAIWAVLAYVKMGDGERAWNLFHQLNPINHTRTMNEVNRYKAEPYVMAADVYATRRHMGRGGWTWYTGAAGWMYQAGLHGILGFNLAGKNLRITPCIPRHWEGYKIKYRSQDSMYLIEIKNPEHKERGISHASLDGVDLPVSAQGSVEIPLQKDSSTHKIEITL